MDSLENCICKRKFHLATAKFFFFGTAFCLQFQMGFQQWTILKILNQSQLCTFYIWNYVPTLDLRNVRAGELSLNWVLPCNFSVNLLLKLD